MQHASPALSGDPGDEFTISATRTVMFTVMLSDATFDTGLVAVGDEIAFIVWGEDED